MRAIVTGGAGFVGQHLSNRLVADGWDVTVLDNFSTGDGKLLDPRIRTVSCDVWRSLPQVGQVSVVFHLAAVSRIGSCAADTQRATDVNFSGTLNVLRLADRHGAKVVFASTCAVKEPSLSVYATTKRSAELLFPTAGVPYTILRLYNVYGPHEPHEGPASTVVARFIHARKMGRSLVIHGTGLQRRDFIHVSDVVDAMVLVARAPDTDTRTYDVGTGVNYSVADVAHFVGGGVRWEPRPYGEQEVTCADPGPLVALGWLPGYNLPSYIAEVCRE